MTTEAFGNICLTLSEVQEVIQKLIEARPEMAEEPLWIASSQLYVPVRQLTDGKYGAIIYPL